MFIARRIISKNKLFTNFISTCNVLNCDEPKDFKKVEEKAKETDSSEEKISDVKLATQNDFSRKKKDKKQKKITLGITEKTVKDVAKEFGGDISKTTQEIFNYLNEMEISKDSKKMVSKENFDENIKIYTRGSRKSHSVSSQLLNLDEVKKTESEPQVKLKIWDDLEAEELKYLAKKSPSNHFEELIAWTEEGKLWHFPIDNDQGMEKEAEISFTEHILLEQYLEPWCPKRGPLRKFMELVLVGLSKNHIYTVEEKKAHIDWYRNYFEEKRKLLQELGAMGAAKERKEIGVSKAEEKA